MRRFIGLGMILVSLLSLPLLIAAVAAIDEQATCQSPFSASATDTILTVNDTGYTATDFADRLVFEDLEALRQMNLRVMEITEQAETLGIDFRSLIMSDALFIQLHDEVRSGAVLAERVLDDLVAEALLWQVLADENITITAADLDDSTSRLVAFDDEFETALAEAGIAGSALEAYRCRNALYAVAAEAIFGEQETALYVNSAHILVPERGMAQMLLDAINDEADFERLARAHSVDAISAASGGDRGWQPAALFGAAYAQAAADAELGAITGPVQTERGWHLLLVRDRETRAIEAAFRADVQRALLENWLTERRDGATVTIADDWEDAIPQALRPLPVPVAPGNEA